MLVLGTSHIVPMQLTCDYTIRVRVRIALLHWVNHRVFMLTCLASMPYNNQRTRDVVDDAVELDVATKMVGLGWRLVVATGIGNTLTSILLVQCLD